METVNVKEQIRNGRVISAEVAAEAKAEMQKQKDEKLKREIINRTVTGEYNRKKALLDLQRNRDEEPIIKIALTETNKIQDKMGKGECTFEEFDTEIRAIEERKRKELNAIINEYDELQSQLYKQTEEARRGW